MASLPLCTDVFFVLKGNVLGVRAEASHYGCGAGADGPAVRPYLLRPPSGFGELALRQRDLDLVHPAAVVLPDAAPRAVA